FLRLSCLITVFGVVSVVLLLNTLAKNIQAVMFINLAMIVCGILLYFFPATRQGNHYAFKIERFSQQKSNWVDACLWVQAHLPTSSTFLTPPGEEGFTYLASHSNIGDFKTNPDGPQFLAEWYERMKDLAGGTLPQAKGFANRGILNHAYAE